MGWFGKKKEAEPPAQAADAKSAPSNGTADPKASAAASAGPAPGGIEFSPDKAAKFFDKAAILHDATNFEYAMVLWLKGLRFEPNNMQGTEGFFKTAASYMSGGAKGPSKDAVKEVSGRSALDKYLLRLVEWSAKPLEASNAVRAMQGASELGMKEPALWIADRAFGATRKEKKPRKEHYVAVMETYRKFQQFEKAVAAGEAALAVDPADGRLANLIRNTSAESTMTRGGFDQTGQAGGFRANIRDSDAQRKLEDQDRIVKTEEVLARQIDEARAAYEANPVDRPSIAAFGKLLMERRRPEDEDIAEAVYAEAFRTTQEYRFREAADQIRMLRRRRELAKLKHAAAQPNAGAAEAEAYKAAERAYLEEEIESFKAKVIAYPTDLTQKIELGQRYYKIGRFQEAIGLFQDAKADVKNRARVLNMLGLSFQAIGGFNDEAVETLRQALDAHTDHSDAVGLELRYGLMCALLARAEETRNLPDAEEGAKIASTIAIQQIGYREVLAKREQIKQLLAALRGGGAGGGGG